MAPADQAHPADRGVPGRPEEAFPAAAGHRAAAAPPAAGSIIPLNYYTASIVEVGLVVML